MRNRALFFAVIAISFASCGQSGTQAAANPDNDKLTCIIPGGDSIFYYTGGSSRMQDLKRGSITDTVFMNGMFRTVKERGFLLVLKPGDGGGMSSNFQEMVNLLNDHDVDHRSADTLDINEVKAFGFSTPPTLKAAMKGQPAEPLTLLPKDDSDTTDRLAGFPRASRLVILLSDEKDIYAYTGNDLKAGKKYTYPELRELLETKKPDKDFSVVIRPAASSTYKNTVDMLDEMKTAGIQHYALAYITREEEDHLRQIYR